MTDFLHYEDFREGQTFALGSHTLSEDEIIAYASEFDPQPQHIDAEAAKSNSLENPAPVTAIRRWKRIASYLRQAPIM